jgi:hypothetical protein
MAPESNDNRLLLDGKDSRLGSLGACREINDGLALLPLRGECQKLCVRDLCDG